MITGSLVTRCREVGLLTVYDGYVVWTLLIFSKYSITISILTILVHFKVILLLNGYTCLCLAYVVFSADYGFLNIVSAYL